MDSDNREPMLSRKKKKRPWYLNCLCCKEDEPTQNKTGGTSMIRQPVGVMSDNSMGLLMDSSDATSSNANSNPKQQNPQNIRTLSIKGSYPTNQVFILGKKDKIVAKITHVKVSKAPSNFSSGQSLKLEVLEDKDSPSPIKWSTKLLNAKHDIFSLWDKGIKADKLEEITPEAIAKHIASRLKYDLVIDALCGFGGNTLQFAKFSNFVLGIDIEPGKTEGAKHNASVYDVGHKIDFLTADFLRVRNLSADVVFLAPSKNPLKPGERFSLTKHIFPDLTQLVIKSLEISRCIAIMLPGDTDLDELASFFNNALAKNELFSKRFCVEIEKIFNTADEIEYVVVYFGDCSSIGEEDEYSSIYAYLAKDEPAEWTMTFPSPFVLKIIEKVGIRKSFKFISEIEEKKAKGKLQDTSMFEALQEKLINENIFTADAIKKIRETESKRRIAYKNAPGQKGTVNKKGILDDTDSRNSKNNTLSLPNTFKDPNPGDYSDPQNMKGTPFEPSFKNSHELSELAVSLYTVEDNYFNSGEDEDVFDKSLGAGDQGFMMKREDEPDSFDGEKRDLNILMGELGGEEKMSPNENDFELTVAKRKGTGMSTSGKNGKKPEIVNRNSEL